MLDNDKAADKTKQLMAALSRVGLEPMIIKAIDNTLSVDAIDDFLKLPPEVQNQAYLAAVSKSDRAVLEFVQKVKTEVQVAVEIERSGGGVRARPGGVNGVYGGLKPHGIPPSKAGNSEKAVVGFI